MIKFSHVTRGNCVFRTKFSIMDILAWIEQIQTSGKLAVCLRTTVTNFNELAKGHTDARTSWLC